MVQKNPMGNLILMGIPMLYADQLPAVTLAGDNSVLAQQTAKDLLRFVDNVEQQNKVRESNKFLMRVKKFLDHDKNVSPYVKLQRSSDLKSTEVLEDILGLLVFTRIQTVRARIGEDVADGADMKVIWNDKRQKDLIEMTYLYISVINYFFAKEILDTNRFPLDGETKKLLLSFVRIYGLNLLKDNVNEIFMSRILENDEKVLSWIDENLKESYDELKDKVWEIREQLFHGPEDVGSVADFRKVSHLGEMEQKVMKEYGQNARELMKNFNSYSKI